MSEFLSMGGFGFFIWMSFGATLILMLGEPLWLKLSRKSTLKSLRRFIRVQSR
ncbi:MAG: Unknown protein [uncultured Thiotrichaceae bacterium]|uniref:Heme exporter protein D n=1 Tax=uncultured Thiotrichaceae bacterium TaxID=298394 RepID=A0A6S6TAD8_9GAMM|nr:MAG: Unknown protein [uncultured Thiotrichaceae bacterium]